MFEFILAHPDLFTTEDIDLFMGAGIITPEQADNIRTEVKLHE